MKTSELVKQKSKSLIENGKVIKEFETQQRIHFTVFSNTQHSVIFDKEKKEWTCDCQFFSLKQKECSHILACKLFLNINSKNTYAK
jgi:hypothetical protein